MINGLFVRNSRTKMEMVTPDFLGVSLLDVHGCRAQRAGERTLAEGTNLSGSLVSGLLIMAIRGGRIADRRFLVPNQGRWFA